jgi:hypothetical protein
MCKLILLTSFFIAASFLEIKAQPPAQVIPNTKQQQLEHQFLKLETKWMNAWKEKDLETCRTLLADEFTLTSSLSTGDLLNKEQWLAAVSRYNCKSFRFNKIMVRKYGRAAIVNSWFYQEADANGKDWTGTFLITDAWVRKGSKWQVVTRHATWLQPK